MAENNIGTLEEEALKRKERLQALKRKSEDNKENKSDTPSKLPTPKFRSYRPQDDSLKEKVLDDAKPGNVEAEVQDQLSAANTKVVIEELDISNLAPRKPDWDLKRGIAKRLEKLMRRADKAIAELIRDRLKQGQHIWEVEINTGAKEQTESPT
ncbi:coiled-coil domain-containing protein 12 [Lasioglossum baleicum]|uniref:coiled-coil domain-containing protein 12 n=1 Tax=Lasioglossum baleicum TaxID=434251 RepID=UPI003FCE87EA